MLAGPRTQPTGQWLLCVGAMIIIAGLFVVAPETVDVWVLSGGVVILLACIVNTVIWRMRPTHGTAWIALIPIIDIVAIIPLRFASQGTIPGGGFLLLFPIGWLAFAFPWPFLVAGLAVSVAIPVGDAVAQGGVIPGLHGWVTIGTLPVLLALLALTVLAVARTLARQRDSASSARTRMSDALRSSKRNEATMAALGDATPEAFVVFGPDGAPLLMNLVAQRWVRRAGLEHDLAEPDTGHIYTENRAHRLSLTPQFFEDVLAGEYVTPRLAWVGPPAEQIAVRFSARPVIVDGDTVAFVMVGSDVTELLRAVDIRDRFLDTVGHELRSPLTVILGNAQLALEGNDTPQRSQARWETVDRAAERLLRVVDRLISAGRDALEARSGDTDVAAIVRDAVTEAAALAESRGVAFAVAAPAGLRARIRDRDLAEIVGELATNAVKFTPATGAVDIRVRDDGADVVVDVVDTGVGMSAGERDQAFERFFRGGYAHAAAVQGAGLGLPIARRLAESNDAELTLTAASDGGTVASLRVRAAVDAPGPVSP